MLILALYPLVVPCVLKKASFSFLFFFLRLSTHMAPKVMPPVYFHGNYNRELKSTLTLFDRENPQLVNTILDPSTHH